MRSFRSTFLLVLATGVVAGCFGSFNPDERKYLCDNTEECIEGYVCVKSTSTQTDDRSEPTQTDDRPEPTQTDDIPSETGPSVPYFCARECEDQSMCPTGFRCDPADTKTGDDMTIRVCVPDDASEEIRIEMGMPPDISTTVSVDTGFSSSMDLGLPGPCEGLGCGNIPMMPDAHVHMNPPDAAISDNGCHSACTAYCEFTETQCQLPCSLSQCVGVCDASDGAISNDIIAQTLLPESNCGQIIDDNSGTNATIVDIEYRNLAVSCIEFCQDLGAYLTDPINGAGEVCGEYLQCDQLDCIAACETSPNEFGESLGDIIFSQTHAICPLAKKLVPSVNGTSQYVSVKNVCIPCESTCSVLFPDDASAADGISEFWCGITQRHSPCPAVSSRAVCNAQCERHPEQFFVSNALEICGDPTPADPVSVIEGNTPLCGAQCESTNTDWGDVGTLTVRAATLIHYIANEEQTIEVERGTRICFREPQAASGDHPRCDLVISIDGRRSAFFEVIFDPIGDEGSVSDLSHNTLRSAAKFTAHGEGAVSEDLFLMGIYQNYEMVLRESISDPTGDPDTQFYDEVVPMLNDGDVALVSRRISAFETRMEFTFNDVQTPSALTIDHFTIGSTSDIDGSCQNQCFEHSGDDFCQDLCDPEEGLMALCAQTITMPRRPGVPFTSNLSQSGRPQSKFCALGETSGREFSSEFDTESCFRECKRNRCDLQFQVNALWHPGRVSEGGRCHRLNFGGYQGWRLDRNFPNESGPLSSEQLCCLCSHEYCADVLSNTDARFECGN